MKHRIAVLGLVLCASGAATVFWARPASASEDEEVESAGAEYDWRQGTRRRESPQNWAFELRFGQYKPRVDDEFDGKASPFKQVYGDGGHFYFGFEVDWQALRIPYIGSLGPGFGWGYTKMSAPAMLTGKGTPSAESTGLWIMPMYLAAVLRIDEIARRWSIPLVPYGKFGMGYALWKASNELGVSNQGGVEGQGASYGLHMAGGLALQLDFLDGGAVQQLDNSTGINHAYAYFEWMYSDLGGLTGGQMHVGTSSWVLGIAFEM
jgi:hypothetical protein